MRKTSFFKKIIFIAIAIGTITSGIFIIRAASNKGAAPVAWWKFDEGSGTSAYDSSGNGNTGTLTNMDNTDWVNGEFGSALDFDGSNDYVNTNTDFSWAIADSFSIAFWVNPTSVTGGQGIMGKGAAGGYGDYNWEWSFKLDGTSLSFVYWNTGGGGEIVLGSTVTQGTWDYFVVTYDPTNKAKLYKNGVVVSTDTSIASALQNRATPMLIGHAYYNSGVNYYFNGLIDDTRVYNHTRTADQIKNDYNGGKAMYVGAKQPVCDTSPADCVNKGLVGYWDMDQMNGTTATDKSGNGNTGTFASSPVWTGGIKPFSGGRAGGGALQFDGTDDYVNAGQGSSLNGLTSVTLSAWIKPYGYSASYRSGIISRRRSGGAAEGLNFTMGGALETPYKLAIYEAGGVALYANTVISPNQWSFVTATLSGTDAKIYINGVLDATGTVSWNWPSDVNVSIGAVYSGVYHFNGLIDDVRVYNRALSAAEIRYQYNQGDPVAYWKMDEGSGTSAYDSSGNGNTGTLTNMDNTDWVNGEFGTALDFDGSNDYVEIVDNASLDPSNAITVSMWFRPDQTLVNYQGVLGKGGGSSFEKGYEFATNNDVFGFWINGSTNMAVTTKPASGELAFWVGTFDGTQIKLYKNGNLVNTVNYIATITDTNLPFRIGRVSEYGGNDEYTKGMYDDVRIYNYARTADQIKNDYNGGKAMYVGAKQPVCDTSPADCVNKGLVGYWDMDQMNGTTATDKSGNGNTGTFASSPVWTGGIKPFSGGRAGGGALQFDGSDDYVSGSGVNIANSPFTISAWIKADQFNTRQFFSIGSVGSLRTAIHLRLLSSTSFLFGLYSDDLTVTMADMSNRWTHIVVTFDSSFTQSVYQDGVFVNSRTAGGYFTGNTNWNIGRWMTTEYFDGFIDDVRVYNRALSAAEIRYQYNQGDPIAHWSFDEGSGLSAYDKSGNSNTGTLTNMDAATDWVNGEFGSALDFDGSNDYVSINGNPDLFRGSRTYELWFYPHFNSDSGVSNFMFSIYLNDGNEMSLYNYSNGFYGFAYKAGGSANYISAGSFTANNWYHIVATFDDDTNEIKVYHNGVLQNQGTESNAIVAGTTYTKIGMYVLDGWFNGLIDDVRIYNYARTADQIKNDYNAGKALYIGAKQPDCDTSPGDCVNKGLVGYWDMDQMTGTTATDKSGNGNTGTLTSGPLWAQGVQPFQGGKIGGGALQFDGTDDYVGVTRNANLEPASAFSIETWVKVSAFQDSEWNTSQIISKYGGNYKGYILSLNKVGSSWYFYFTTCTPSTCYGTSQPTQAVSLGQWYHLVAVFQNGSPNLMYVNGVLVGQSANAAITHDTAQNLFIGKAGWYSSFFNGTIDDVRVYNRALSPAEIRYHY
ncbi:MAG: LamG domain-containing protein [Patescibacteria group bacterium]|nr:LamG domain-containing protein [Patescibacteria group bacterium]